MDDLFGKLKKNEERAKAKKIAKEEEEDKKYVSLSSLNSEKELEEQRKDFFGIREDDYGQLPLWPEDARGVPNAVLRSALFGAIKRGRRPYFTAFPKASVDGVQILFTGPQLDQADLDVWQCCLHMAKGKTLTADTKFYFKANGFLTMIGRQSGKSQHEWLKGSFRRLMTSLVEIQDSKRGYAGQLLHSWGRDEESGEWAIQINPRIASLFNNDTFTYIEWSQRAKLKSPLAQWLHGFYSTHRNPYPYKVATIHTLCGSNAKNLTDFKKDLKKALKSLEDNLGWNAKINDMGLVEVKRPNNRAEQEEEDLMRAGIREAMRKKTGKQEDELTDEDREQIEQAVESILAPGTPPDKRAIEKAIDEVIRPGSKAQA